MNAEEVMNTSDGLGGEPLDDREHIIDVIDLRKLNDDDYCCICGQIGCWHDGRERS